MAKVFKMNAAEKRYFISEVPLLINNVRSESESFRSVGCITDMEVNKMSRSRLHRFARELHDDRPLGIRHRLNGQPRPLSQKDHSLELWFAS